MVFLLLTCDKDCFANWGDNGARAEADCGLLGKEGGALRGRFAPAVCLVCKTPAWRLRQDCSSRPFGEYLSILTVICYLPSRCRMSGLHITIKQHSEDGF